MASAEMSNISTIMLIIFWDFYIFYQVSLPQVKRSVIITNKHVRLV